MRCTAAADTCLTGEATLRVCGDLWRGAGARIGGVRFSTICAGLAVCEDLLEERENILEPEGLRVTLCRGVTGSLAPTLRRPTEGFGLRLCGMGLRW